MKQQRNELYRLSLELARGKVLQISEPMKLKKLQLDENGKKIGEYEEVVMTVREQYLPPVKEALQILVLREKIFYLNMNLIFMNF